MNIKIKAEAYKWPRISKALEKGHQLYLVPTDDGYRVRNILVDRMKNGTPRVGLWSYKEYLREGELGLSKNILTMAFKGSTFTAIAECVELEA